MNPIRSSVFRVAEFFVLHDIFIRFMIAVSAYAGGLATARTPGLFSGDLPEPVRLILTALLLASLPDTLVVAIGHPHSRRSQLVLCAVVMIMSASVYLFRGNVVGVPIRP